MSDSSGQNSGQKNGLGVAALILGIISLVGGFLPFLAALLLGIWPPLAAIGSILAIIFGFLGLKRVKNGEASNRGMALAGMLLGIAGIVITFVVAVVIGIFMAAGK